MVVVKHFFSAVVSYVQSNFLRQDNLYIVHLDLAKTPLCLSLALFLFVFRLPKPHPCPAVSPLCCSLLLLFVFLFRTLFRY